MISKNLIFLIFLSLPHSVSPISSFSLFKGPGGQTILILGDRHDDRYLPNVKLFVEEVKSVELMGKLPLILELPIESLRFIEHIPPTLRHIVQTWNKPKSPVTLEFFEPRGISSDTVESLRDKLNSSITTLVEQKELLAFPKKSSEEGSQVAWQDHVNKMLSLKKSWWGCAKNELCISDLLKDLDESEKKVKAVLQKHKDHKPVFDNLKSWYELFLRARFWIKNDLKKYHETFSLRQVMYDEYL